MSPRSNRFAFRILVLASAFVVSLPAAAGDTPPQLLFRVSADHGLSLHYTDPKEQIVIIDDKGLLTRATSRDTVSPEDPRAGAANSALLHVLRFDLAGLAKTFELYGVRTGAAWQLALVPKDDSLRRTLGRISIEGEGPAVRRIELRRSPVQRVEILIAPPTSTAPFSDEELHRFFR